MTKHFLKLSITLLAICNIWVACQKSTTTPIQEIANETLVQYRDADCGAGLILGVVAPTPNLVGLEVCGIRKPYPLGEFCSSCGSTYGKFLIDGGTEFQDNLVSPNLSFTLRNKSATGKKLKVKTTDPCCVGLMVTLAPNETAEFHFANVNGCCEVIANCQ